ncbi:hypothetical protein VIGAN_10224600 [Vigna angularis var. angularis]|uniref:Uncharacterized protein n=1 Tax=Vigna angularis var. angularis TaxID=157739 RepID=A0A0S3T5W0_PHAAN|nr:hypothetical protein VIGAN_10224600 [Vigna angularis var. angularis]
MLGAAEMGVGYNLNVENSVGEIDVVECKCKVTLQTNIFRVCLCHFKSFGAMFMKQSQGFSICSDVYETSLLERVKDSRYHLQSRVRFVTSKPVTTPQEDDLVVDRRDTED